MSPLVPRAPRSMGPRACAHTDQSARSRRPFRRQPECTRAVTSGTRSARCRHMPPLFRSLLGCAPAPEASRGRCRSQRRRALRSLGPCLSSCCPLPFQRSAPPVGRAQAGDRLQGAFGRRRWCRWGRRGPIIASGFVVRLCVRRTAPGAWPFMSLPQPGLVVQSAGRQPRRCRLVLGPQWRAIA